MPREEIVVPSRELSYEGIFSVSEVLDIIKRFLDESGYLRIERVHEYKVHADGAQIDIKGFHERKITESDVFEFDTFLMFNKIKDVEMTIQGEKKKLNSGRVSINFKGILFTNKDKDWYRDSKKPFTQKHAVIQWISDRFVFKEHLLELRAMGKKDVDDLYARLLEYFQAQHYRRRS